MRLFLLVFLVSQMAQAASMTFQDIKNLIEKSNAKSVEEVLPLLPKELRSHFSLMHTSQSLQAASHQNPRAILYGRDARLVLTFNGDSNQSGYNSLEIMEFTKDAKFRFSSIDFENNEPVFRPSATRCLECHSSNYSKARPLWDHYPFWRGAYGGEHDLVTKDAEAIKYLGRQKTSYDEFLAFRATMASHPRYKHLIFPAVPDYLKADQAAVYPYAFKFDQLGDNQPNVRFGFLLSDLFAEQIAAAIKSLPRWKKAPHSIIRDLTDDRFGRSKHIQKSLEQSLIRLKKQTNVNYSSITTPGAQRLAAFLASEFTKIPLQDWFASIESDYFFTDGNHEPQYLHVKVLQRLKVPAPLN